jgi:NAD(P)-dependent dehydrogenase (short-subunit alcohol dehydrogenase family)
MTYDETTTTDEVLEGVDLRGKVAVVTGASTGLGLETARALAAAGAHVVLAVRHDDKGADAIGTIRAQVADASLEHGICDLTSLESVRAFAASLLERHPRVDLLVNNAGVMYTPLERTAEGFELQFGTNHLGHFVLTNLLVPALIAAAPSRIVNLSSGGHQSSDILWDDPNYERRPYDKFESYGQSKTANILFTVELDRRLAPSGVRAYAVHPGMIATELGRYMTKDDMRELRARASRGPSGGLPSYKSIAAGAATTVWAATAPELADTGGVYLADCAIAPARDWSLDPTSAARLWTMSEELVGQRLPRHVLARNSGVGAPEVRARSDGASS